MLFIRRKEKETPPQRVYNQETACLCKRFLVKKFMPGSLREPCRLYVEHYASPWYSQWLRVLFFSFQQRTYRPIPHETSFPLSPGGRCGRKPEKRRRSPVRRSHRCRRSARRRAFPPAEQRRVERFLSADFRHLDARSIFRPGAAGLGSPPFLQTRLFAESTSRPVRPLPSFQGKTLALGT